MKSLQDALYNWLTIKVVRDARPEDQAAKDTFALFDDMLKEDHKVTEMEIDKDEVMYFLRFLQEGKEKTARFPIELIDVMIDQIESEPEKYPNYDVTE